MDTLTTQLTLGEPQVVVGERLDVADRAATAETR